MKYNFIINSKMQNMIDLAKGTNYANKLYPQLVNYLIRQKPNGYSQSEVEAIMNNYLDDMTNEKHITEFRELQDYRIACKQEAKRLLGLEED